MLTEEQAKLYIKRFLSDGNTSGFKAVLKQYPVTDEHTRQVWISKLVLAGHTDALLFLIDHWRLTDKSRDAERNTILMFATKHSASIVVHALCKSFGINEQNIYGKTALHLSVELEKYSTTDALLENNVDPEIKDIKGKTPLIYAIEGKKWCMINKLLTKGATAGAWHSAVHKPIITLACVGSQSYFPAHELVKMFVKHGADINDTDCNGQTALMVAVEKGDASMANALLSAGARTDLVNKHNESIFDLDAKNDPLRILKVTYTAPSETYYPSKHSEVKRQKMNEDHKTKSTFRLT